MKASIRRGIVLSALALASAAPAWANSAVPPPGLRDVVIEQRLDQALPLDLRFRDESDNPVKLGDFFGQKPVLLSFVYYHCPMLCPMALEGLVIVASYGRDHAATGWHFLVGEGDAGRRLAEAVGFHFRYDGSSDQFAHATGLFVLTPLGRISRVLFGVDYAPRDVRLALVEASQQKIGTLADQLLLFCYHYDPATGKYGPAAMAGVRIGAVLTLVGLAAFIVTQLRHESAQRKA
jgi:protein SCO1/2